MLTGDWFSSNLFQGKNISGSKIIKTPIREPNHYFGSFLICSALRLNILDTVLYLNFKLDLITISHFSEYWGGFLIISLLCFAEFELPFLSCPWNLNL